jgi:predicted nucleic acid-binding protein
LRRIATIDASPLINLAHLGLAGEVQRYFDRVLVPRAVQREVNRKGRFRTRLNRLLQGPCYERCATSDEWNVNLLRNRLDPGEAEALIQAQERGALYFIGDERRARQTAELLPIRPVGTLRLLARLHLEGRADELPQLVQRLQRDLGFRVGQELVQQAIELADQPI